MCSAKSIETSMDRMDRISAEQQEELLVASSGEKRDMDEQGRQGEGSKGENGPANERHFCSSTEGLRFRVRRR